MKPFLTITALLASGVLHAQPVNQLIPISAFVKEDQFSRPRMSPDGKHLAVTMRMPMGSRTVPVMTFYSLPELKVESTVAMPINQVPIDYQWVSNTRLVVQKGREMGSREQPFSYGEVLAMEYDASKQEYLFGWDMEKNSGRRGPRYAADYAFANIASVPNALNGNVFVNYYAWYGGKESTLYEVNTKTGYRKTIATVDKNNFRFTSQYDGQPRFAFGLLDDGMAATLRYDDAAKRWTQLDRSITGELFQPFAFSADDSEYLAWHSANGGPEVIVRENVKTGARRQLASHADGSLGTLMYGSARDLPIAVWTTVGIPQVRYLQDETHPDVVLHKQLSQQFPGAIVQFVDFTQDGNKLLFSVFSDRDPGSFFLFDRKSYHADILFTRMEDIRPELMSERRAFTYTARDGLPIHGYLTVPKQRPAGKLPMILLPHGGPHGASDEWAFHTDAQFLASRGYAVLQLNYRGSGSRGPAFERAGYRQWNDKIMDDLADGVSAAIATSNIDKDRVCIFGSSFGGYAALNAPSRYPGMFKCAVGYAGVYDLKLIFDERDTREEKAIESLYKRYISSDVKELDRISPAMHAEQIKLPVLLIHGGRDTVAPEEHALRMKKALEKAGNAPEWYYESAEGHGFYGTEKQTEVYRRLEAFFAKHIGK